MDDDRELIRKEIHAAFKVNAFAPKRDALDLCVDVVRSSDKSRRARWMEKIVATLRKQSLTNSVVTKEILSDVFTQISNGGREQITSLFNVFDGFSLPCFSYDQECKKMLKSKDERKIVANVNKVTLALQRRFQLVAQRAHRSEKLEKIKFCTIESLLGTIRKRDDVVIIGMLSQQKADCYHVEDMSGSLQLDLSETIYRPGLYTEGGIYMFEGTFDANLLIVSNAALVPVESIQQTRNFFGNENWFGGEDTIAFYCNKKLMAAEQEDPEASIVILSDVHLDQTSVLQALYQLWQGFISCPPVAFVLCGNFCSRSRQPDTMQLLDAGFQRLANQLKDESFRAAFKDTNFVFVPGPDDPSLNMFLPRPHLPASLFKHLESIPNCSFATNPARIQYASKEIVILRDDIIEKICRHTVNKVHQSDIPKYFCRTILSQAHLSPLPTHVAPVLWDWDHVLSLHPLPDLLVCADKFSSFIEDKLGDTIVVNPGSLSRGKFGFHVYYPQQSKVEDSEIILP